jgi:hypothetical protein
MLVGGMSECLRSSPTAISRGRVHWQQWRTLHPKRLALAEPRGVLGYGRA